MCKLGYREKMLKAYKENFKVVDGELKNIGSLNIANISLSDISYRFVTDVPEIRELMEDVFDTPFWEDVLEGINVEERLEEGGEFIVFEIEGMPFGLVSLSNEEDLEREIYQFDIEDFVFGRGNGLGSKVIHLLKHKIYKDETLVGYSVSEAAKFWARNASSYDEEAYDDMKEEYLRNGGEEDELFEVNGLVYFEL